MEYKIRFNNKPLFSVVVLTFNHENLIEETLNSIYNQNYPNIELIISDDASTDNTIPIIKSWIDKHKSRFLRVELITSLINTGISANHARGVRIAKGEFIKYIGGDDILLPSALEKMEAFLKENNDAYVCTSFVQPFIDYGNGEIEKLPLIPKDNFEKMQWRNNIYQFRQLSKRNFLPAPGFFFRKDVLEKSGYFDSEFRKFEDWHTWLKIILKGYKIYFMPEITVKWRIHKNSVSTSSRLQADLEFYKEELMVYEKYILPNIKYLSILERIHIYSSMLYLKLIIRNIRYNKLRTIARMVYIFDPIELIEMPKLILERIIFNRKKKLRKLSNCSYDSEKYKKGCNTSQINRDNNRYKLAYITAQAPYGKGETFINGEMLAIKDKAELFIFPRNPEKEMQSSPKTGHGDKVQNGLP